jgi:hypothetical protein
MIISRTPRSRRCLAAWAITELAISFSSFHFQIRGGGWGLPQATARTGVPLGAAMSMRQILLHVVPGTGAYGNAIFGLHLYTWAFISLALMIIGKWGVGYVVGRATGLSRPQANVLGVLLRGRLGFRLSRRLRRGHGHRLLGRLRRIGTAAGEQGERDDQDSSQYCVDQSVHFGLLAISLVPIGEFLRSSQNRQEAFRTSGSRIRRASAEAHEE